MRAPIVYCSALLIAAACGTTEPAPARAVVRVPVDRIVATTRQSVGSGGPIVWLDFTVPVTVTNVDSLPIGMTFCSERVEQSAGIDWRIVWGPICVASLGSSQVRSSMLVPPVPIQPGESRELSIHVNAALQGPGRPEWGDGTVEGAYRVSFGFVAGTGGAAEAFVVSSNPFVLVRQ